VINQGWNGEFNGWVIGNGAGISLNQMRVLGNSMEGPIENTVFNFDLSICH
jgi:hypothetical protein